MMPDVLKNPEHPPSLEMGGNTPDFGAPASPEVSTDPLSVMSAVEASPSMVTEPTGESTVKTKSHPEAGFISPEALAVPAKVVDHGVIAVRGIIKGIRQKQHDRAKQKALYHHQRAFAIREIADSVHNNYIPQHSPHLKKTPGVRGLLDRFVENRVSKHGEKLVTNWARSLHGAQTNYGGHDAHGFPLIARDAEGKILRSDAALKDRDNKLLTIADKETGVVRPMTYADVTPGMEFYMVRNKDGYPVSVKSLDAEEDWEAKKWTSKEKARGSAILLPNDLGTLAQKQRLSTDDYTWAQIKSEMAHAREYKRRMANVQRRRNKINKYTRTFDDHDLAQRLDELEKIIQNKKNAEEQRNEASFEKAAIIAERRNRLVNDVFGRDWYGRYRRQRTNRNIHKSKKFNTKIDKHERAIDARRQRIARRHLERDRARREAAGR